MKVLTAEQMREVDRQTMDLGIPGLILMENAGHRVVEVLERKFSPLSEHRIVVLCGRGNNGGDGFVVARQLWTRFRPKALYVVLAGDPAELKGDAAANYQMLKAVGCPVYSEITPEMRSATLVIDALLGTGLTGPPRGPLLQFIEEILRGFPEARVVAVDIPSGLSSDSGEVPGKAVRADVTVTFTAPKVGHVLPPACDYVGELHVCPIGSPPELYEQNEHIRLHLTTPADFRNLFLPRPPGAHKGTFGHVLIVAGSRSKPGAAAMAGMAALRIGAGLVTVASAVSALPMISSHAPELMMEPLEETAEGRIAAAAWETLLDRVLPGKTVVALGPGLGTEASTVELVRRFVTECPLPMVIDADGLNALAGYEFRATALRILTPHPGEMARLLGTTSVAVQSDRLGSARRLAEARNAIVVLKGQRTVIAQPDGNAWVNPTGCAALATGGTGDILTGMLAGLLAQRPDAFLACTLAAVYLHGRCGELASKELTESVVTATDLLRYLPDAIREVVGVS